MDFWGVYITLYTLLAFSYVWYRYLFLLIYKLPSGNFLEKVSIIIPFYNEDISTLKNTLFYADQVDIEKEIIVVDDGSESLDCYNMVKDLNIPLTLLRFNKNKGKREAQMEALKYVNNPIVVTVDSDTVLKRDSIKELIKPFAEHRIGATTGNLKITNRNTNLLTKIISSRYWNAFNLERKSQDSLNNITCCSGPISAYRTNILREVKDNYLNQIFLNKKCTFGDDRHLTTLVLKKGYNIKYVDNAIAYTEAPINLNQFLKQQVRWRKSFIRESILLFLYLPMVRNKKLLIELLLTTALPILSLLARVMLIFTIIIKPIFVLYTLPILLIMGLLHSFYSLIKEKKHFIYSMMYSFFHIFLVYWTLPYALLTLNKTEWGTR